MTAEQYFVILPLIHNDTWIYHYFSFPGIYNKAFVVGNFPFKKLPTIAMIPKGWSYL
jgi:hypothetical protein